MEHASSLAVPALVATLEELRTKKADLDAEYHGRVAELNHNIAAYERVIACETGTPIPASTTSPNPLPAVSEPITRQTDPRQSLSPEPDRSTSWTRSLRGLTQPEALIRIAEENGGLVRVMDAKKIFLEAGLSKGKLKNVNSHIHHILARSDRFERVGAGVFRLQPVTRSLEGLETTRSQFADLEDSSPTDEQQRALATLPTG